MCREWCEPCTSHHNGLYSIFLGIWLFWPSTFYRYFLSRNLTSQVQKPSFMCLNNACVWNSSWLSSIEIKIIDWNGSWIFCRMCVFLLKHTILLFWDGFCTVLLWVLFCFKMCVALSVTLSLQSHRLLVSPSRTSHAQWPLPCFVQSFVWLIQSSASTVLCFYSPLLLQSSASTVLCLLSPAAPKARDGRYCNAPRPSVRPSVCMSVCLSVRLSVRLSVCPSVRLSVTFSFRTVTQKRIDVFSWNFAGTCTKSWGCAV